MKYEYDQNVTGWSCKRCCNYKKALKEGCFDFVEKRVKEGLPHCAKNKCGVYKIKEANQ